MPEHSSPKVVTVPCKYKTGKTLGQGTYACVKEAVHIESGKHYAVKVINKQAMRGKEKLIRNEIAVLRKISQGHRHILTLVDFFETTNNLYLVTELALGGELFDRICEKGNYYEKDAAVLVRTIVEAVNYLHEKDIVHRDLKVALICSEHRESTRVCTKKPSVHSEQPENLLFRTRAEDADLLVADFGLSRIIDKDTVSVLRTTCGTPGYMAPEVLAKTGHGKPVDMWAVGVITYFLLCGYTPFDRENRDEEVKSILNAGYSFTPIEYWKHVSSEAKNFISCLLVVNPNERLTAQQALEHPWLRDLARTNGQRTPEEQRDLLPNIRENFNARRMFRKAVDVVKLVNNLKNKRNSSHASPPTLVLPHEEDLVGKDVIAPIGSDSESNIHV
ncbi:Pkinase-domain-containing protein [Basidiobolus meristosporus CBS 931.73]|uniref:Pkinase-domain-containing protein n=1 Tax=Basidiobolus meristosporus CBS 931.73 TaxID=1314790 RepID=A0A1Y1XTZ3_9FUNG|nr:Pkinase-domain-containing protein [Basidiobolus meristosporus CBS 931.73]|eukprot:ORX89155.1 Pkinase-domain-containing protein [Basidiobolus meristosporus CBS 931.73]